MIFASFSFSADQIVITHRQEKPPSLLNCLLALPSESVAHTLKKGEADK
jgi:hypothetical protein